MPRAGRAEVGSAGETGGAVPEVRSILPPASMASKQTLIFTGGGVEVSAGALGVAVAIPAYVILGGGGFVGSEGITWPGCSCWAAAKAWSWETCIVALNGLDFFRWGESVTPPVPAARGAAEAAVVGSTGIMWPVGKSVEGSGAALFSFISVRTKEGGIEIGH